MKKGMFLIVLLFFSCCAGLYVIPVKASPDQEIIVPDGQGYHSQWGYADTSAWEAVADQDNTTTYIIGDAEDEIHTFTLENCSLVPGDTIQSLYLNVIFQSPGGGAGPEKMWGIWRTYDTDYQTLSTTVTRDSWTQWDWPKTINPYTETAWTIDEVNDLEVGAQVQTLGSGEYIWISKIWVEINYTPGVVNDPPVNEDCTIPDRDDDDLDTDWNLYAQRVNYTILYNVSDAQGYADIDYAEVRLLDGATQRAIFRFDEDTNTFSVELGQWDLNQATSTYDKSGNNLNITFKVTPQWDAIEIDDGEIECYVVDDEPESDTDTLQTDYYDVITNLLIKSVGCQDPDSPDRVPVSSTQYIDIQVRYSYNPASSLTPSNVFYPPDWEFDHLDLWNSTDDQKGGPYTVTNGDANDGSFTADADVGSENYYVYIDMADADYTDGKETNEYETVISDRVKIYYFQVNDSRVDVDAWSEVRVKGLLEYDDTLLGSGDEISVNGTALSWDAVNGWFDNSWTFGTVSNKTFVITYANETGFVIDENQVQNVSDPWTVWDRLNIVLSADDYTPELDVTVNFTVTVTYEYDSGSCTTWEVDIWRNGTANWKDDLTDGDPDFTDVSAVEITYRYDVTQDVSETTYGLTAFSEVAYIDVHWAEANIIPTNDQCSITDMDDTDDIYAQRLNYTIDYDVTDGNGFANIDYAEARLKQGGITRAIFRYDEDTDTFSIESGSDKWDLQISICQATESGTYINITFRFSPQWDALEEADLEIECYVVDEEPESDLDVMQSDYVDVIVNLLTESIECQDPDDPDRVDVSSSITIDFSVKYADEPGSGTPSTFYPPDYEFTAIHVYDSGDVDKGSDSSIVNGQGSVSFTSEATSKSELYNLYIDMADADYTDGEETPTEQVITDYLNIVLSADDYNPALDVTVNFTVTVTYQYDSGSCTTWEVDIWRNGTANWKDDLTDGDPDFTDVSAIEICYRYDVTQDVSETTYGLTAFSEVAYIEVVWGIADTPPSFDIVGHNSTYADHPGLFYSNWTDDFGLSVGILETNNSGSLVNHTYVFSGSPTYSWLNFTLILNETVGIRIEYEFHVNDTSDQWTSTGLQFLITVLGPYPSRPSPANYTIFCRIRIGGYNGSHHDVNITVINLIEDMSVILYNSTGDQIASFTVASGETQGNLSLPDEYRTSTFLGTLKAYDQYDNHLISTSWDDMRGGDRYKACEDAIGDGVSLFNPLTMGLSLLLIAIPMSILFFIKRK